MPRKEMAYRNEGPCKSNWFPRIISNAFLLLLFCRVPWQPQWDFEFALCNVSIELLLKGMILPMVLSILLYLMGMDCTASFLVEKDPTEDSSFLCICFWKNYACDVGVYWPWMCWKFYPMYSIANFHCNIESGGMHLTYIKDTHTHNIQQILVT